ncbi:hypothetical protein SAMN05444682_104221 [Parapedobacter indicus]|uniref:Uncharacterized protein n=1 Tax=Parapedobacter indicus TaxID=1477437 RepID=A0A1I3IUM5_9SPHI|nr:hypothetical protein CLV26_104221 [Parapedobacter indicus]SFI51642.1 hypothetical protein SAMN05444682_104221 [Parapedobacter indicus]
MFTHYGSVAVKGKDSDLRWSHLISKLHRLPYFLLFWLKILVKIN